MDTRVAVVSVRSVAIGVAAWMSVTAFLGLVVAVPWGLAALTGFAAGAFALALPITLRDGRFDVLGISAIRRRRGVWLLAYSIMLVPMFFIDEAIVLTRPVGLSLALLLGLTGLAAYTLGGIMATLNHLEDDELEDPRLHSVTPARGDEHSAS